MWFYFLENVKVQNLNIEQEKSDVGNDATDKNEEQPDIAK